MLLLLALIVPITAVTFLHNHERHWRLALVLVLDPDNRGLGHPLVPDECVLYLHGGEPVTGDVEDVVDTTGYGVVAVLVTLGAVLDVVDLLGDVGEILLLVALGVLPQSPEHGGPGLVDGQRPTGGVVLDELLFFFVPETREDTGERLGGGAGLELGDTGQRGDHDRARLRLPPGVDDRAVLLTYVLVVPDPRPRVYRLTDRPENPQGGEVVLVYRVGILLHEGANGRGRRVQAGDPVLLDYAPPAVVLGVGRRTLELQRRSAAQERAVNQVRVPGDPANIRRAPPDVVVLEVADPLHGRFELHHVAAHVVLDALGLAGRARGVEDI